MSGFSKSPKELLKLRPWAGKFEVVVVAHRGFSAVAPENTLAAFERAIEVGSDMIELDVRLSKEGEVVVIHDETLKRTTTGQGRVIDQTVGELKSVDAGFKFDPSFRGERIPKLSEVLELSRGRIRVNIELKIGDYRPWTILYLTDRVLAEVERLDMLDQVILSSFDPHPLEWALNLRPSIAVAYLYSRPWTHPREVTGGRPFPILHCFKSVLTKENILRAHQEGIGIGVYTLNTEEEMARFVEMGVDAIITDHPDRLIRLLKKEPP